MTQNVTFGVLCVLSLPSFAMAIDEALLSRFRNEAPTAWQAYAEFCSHLKGNVRFEQIDNLSGTCLKNATYDFKLKWPFAVYENQQAGQGKEVIGDNSKYSFRLEQGLLGNWTVPQLRLIRVPDEEPELLPKSVLGLSDGRSKALGTACHGLKIWASWFPSIARDDTFRVLDISRDDHDGEERIMLVYSYRPVIDAKFNGNNVARDGTVWLLPEKYWLISKAEVKAEFGDSNTAQLSISNEYVASSNNFPVLKRKEQIVKAPPFEDQPEVNHTWKYQCAIEPFDESEKVFFCRRTACQNPRREQYPVRYVGSFLLFLLHL